jgi:hypothetical protein
MLLHFQSGTRRLCLTLSHIALFHSVAPRRKRSGMLGAGSASPAQSHGEWAVDVKDCEYMFSPGLTGRSLRCSVSTKGKVPTVRKISSWNCIVAQWPTAHDNDVIQCFSSVPVLLQQLFSLLAPGTHALPRFLYHFSCTM